MTDILTIGVSAGGGDGGAAVIVAHYLPVKAMAPIAGILHEVRTFCAPLSVYVEVFVEGSRRGGLMGRKKEAGKNKERVNGIKQERKGKNEVKEKQGSVGGREKGRVIIINTIPSPISL